MRVAFVVQRYGAEVAGGAEALCRRTARALAEAGDEVTVYTTTARDYLRWDPHYPAGEERDGPVRVRRYDVLPPDPAAAAALVRRLALAPDDAGERAWALAQGPVAPDLLSALATADRRHEVVALWTYLYATTQLGIPLCRDRAVLVPLAHDEPMLRFGLTRGAVRMAAGLAFLTPEEALLVDDLHGIGPRPWEVVGTGLDPAPAGDPRAVRSRFGLPERFALYLGRVDPAKGVDALVAAHAEYRSRGGRLGLVLAGRATVPLRLPPWVVCTGFVSDEERAGLLAAAEVVVLPSRYESLSLVALEAWQVGRPTLALAASEVVAGQTRRSGGGLTYRDAGGYADLLGRLAGDPELRARLGASGRAFTGDLTWPAAVRRWRRLLAAVRRPVAAGDGQRSGR